MNHYSLDIGGTNSRFSIIDKDGNIVFLEKKLTPKHEIELSEMISDFFVRTGDAFELSEDIGVSVAGLYDNKNNSVIFPNAFEGKKLNVAGLFKNVKIENLYVSDDRTAGIYGEKYFGQGKDMEEFIYLIIGTGVGLGIMKNDTVLNGADFVAGSVGWIKYDQEYSFEQVLAGPGIAGYYQKISGKKADSKEVFKRYLNHEDENSYKTVKRTGEALGKMLSFILNFTNPHRIILGGSIGKQWEFLKGFSESIIFENISPYIKTVDIKVSHLDDNATLLGNVGRITRV